MSREAFEAWALRNTSLSSAHDMAWAAWQAALAQQEAGPIAWGMLRADGLVLDVICPDEHEAFAGEYTAPLYATPQQAQPTAPTIKESFTVAEQSTELDAGMAAQHYCRGLWGAARGHSDWRKVHEHFANGYKQGRYDELQAQGPTPQAQPAIDGFGGNLDSAFDAAPAVQPLSGDVLYALWASENGLEDCKLCRLNDFTKAARFFEQAHGIAAPGEKV